MQKGNSLFSIHLILYNLIPIQSCGYGKKIFLYPPKFAEVIKKCKRIPFVFILPHHPPHLPSEPKYKTTISIVRKSKYILMCGFRIEYRIRNNIYFISKKSKIPYSNIRRRYDKYLTSKGKKVYLR